MKFQKGWQMPVAAGRLVEVQTSRGVGLVRVLSATLPPSPMGNHDGSDKYLLGRRYNAKLRRWAKLPMPYALRDVLRVFPKHRCPC